MEINEFQIKARGTAVYSDNLQTLDPLTYSVLALCGEAGELANKLKKAHRAGRAPDFLVLADELGDVLWYVAAIAHDLGMTLEEVAVMNIEKLAARRAANKIIG